MKKHLLVLLLLVFAINIFAQYPQQQVVKTTVTGYVKNANNTGYSKVLLNLADTGTKVYITGFRRQGDSDWTNYPQLSDSLVAGKCIYNCEFTYSIMLSFGTVYFDY
jgi:hypothetical protein